MRAKRARVCQARVLLLTLAFTCACSGARIADREAPEAGVPDESNDDAVAGAEATRAGSGSNARAGSEAPDPNDDDIASGDAGIPDRIGPAFTEADCRARCEALMPELEVSELPEPCGLAQVSECVTSCMEELDDTDRACGQCVLDYMVWPEPNGGCNDWECVCDGGYPEFPSKDRAQCMTACASTLARQADQRLAAPVPESLGPKPAQLRELMDNASVVALTAAADDRLWIGLHVPPDPVTAQIQQLSAELELAAPLLSLPDFDDDARLDIQGFTSNAGGALFFGLQGTYGIRTFGHDADGAPRFEHVPAVPTGFLSWLDGLALGPSDALLAVIDHGRYLERYDGATGELLWSGMLPSTSLSESMRVAIDRQGDYWIAGNELRKVHNEGTIEAPQLTTTVSVPIRDLGGTVHEIVVDASDHVVVRGQQHQSKRTPESSPYQMVSYAAPFIARFAPDGEPLWLWEHGPDTIITGEIEDIATDAEGNVYAISSEDPYEYGALGDPDSDAITCTVYGCDGLVLRKFAPDGELLWEYQHREGYSGGNAVAVDDQGRVFAGGWVRREVSQGLLLRFDP